MRAALAALLLCAAAAHAAPLHADDFAPSISSDWFRDFRATFDDAAAQRFANPGPWRVGCVNATSIGAWQLRGTPWRPFEASVCYPCADAGCDAVAANPADAAGRWPAVVFGIGWNSWAQRYHNTLQHLASHGFVVLAPTTVDRRFVPRAWEYAQTLVGALQFAAAESARPGSLLASRVDVSRAGAFGHSMGAGSAAIAASLSGDSSWAASLGIEPRAGWPWGSASLLDFDASRAQWPNITALCTLGVAPVTAPLAGLAALRARTLFMVPARDRFVAPEAQRALFDALPTLPGAAPRALALLQGGSHCWLDEPAVRGEWGLPSSQCELAAADAQAYMTPDAQLYVTRKYVAAFFADALARDAQAALVASDAAMRGDPLVTLTVAPRAA